MMNAAENEASPLDPGIVKDLIPSHIATRAELSRWEQDNVNEALAWAERCKPGSLMSEPFLRQFHRRMFCHTWRWAGKFRKVDANLGTPFSQISEALKLLCQDVQYWIDHQTYEPDEIAARFHHRLIYIRPFSNGNGRHAHLVTDLLLERVLNRPVFTWGQASLAHANQARVMYIDSLASAKQTGYRSLLEFVRS